MESILSEHLHTFLTQPQARPEISAALGDLSHFFEELKLFIQSSIHQGKLALAEQAHQFAWAIVQYRADPELQALAHWCSLVFWGNRHTTKALSHAESAQRYYQTTNQGEKEGRILIGMGSQLNLLGRFAAAEQAMLRSIELLQEVPDYRDWPMIYVNLAYIQICQGRYPEAFTTAQVAETMAVNFGARRPEQASRYVLMQASALINQGYTALFLGDFATANRTLSEAQYLAQVYDFHEFVGRAALNLARLATLQGELFTALQLLRSARQRFQLAQFELELATVAIEEALLYERLTMLHQARRAALQAAHSFEQTNLPTECVEAYLIAVRLSLTLREPQQARSYLGATEQRIAFAPPVQQALWQAYHAHPLLQGSVSSYPLALTQVEQAVTQLWYVGAVEEALQASLIAAQLAASSALSTSAQHLATIITKAHAYGLPAIEQEACVRLAQEQSPALALPTLQRAVAILTHIRRQMPAEELKANLITGHTVIYTRLLKVQLQCRRYHDALMTLLEAKGGIWADLAGPVQSQATLPNQASTRLELAFWRDELRAADNPEYREQCQVKIHEIEQTIAVTTRQHAQIRKIQPLPTLSMIQKQLSTQTTVLEYHVADKIWVCLINAHCPPRWLCLGKSPAVRALLEQLTLLLASLQSRQPQERLQTAQVQQQWVDGLLHQLFIILLAPLLLYLPPTGTLLIAPDDFLFQVPWSALASEQGYLGEQYTLKLLPSIALPVLSATSTLPPAPARVLPPTVLGYTGQPPLTCVAAEVAAIQQAYPNVTIALPARTTDLSQHMPGEFLHIAAHARVNPQTPLLSAIELADGPFLLADVLQLNLHGTHLVTLSACETGAPPEQGGLLLALVGAFLCAGAQHVLATLWSVDDEATQLLMTHLYTQLANGTPPAQSLQQAQQALRQTRYYHPFYWAAFQPFARTF